MKNPWDNIKPSQQDVSVLRVDQDHPLDLFWAKDHHGTCLFFYEYTTDSGHSSKSLPVLRGLKIELRKSRDKIFRLVLSLKENGDWEIFSSLCNDIIYSTRAIEKKDIGFSSILNRLLKWHEFLSAKRTDIFSEEKIKGLIGELLFLKNQLIPKYGCADAIQFWTGPEGTAQDFNVNGSTVEVKTQMSGTSPTIKISSSEQLCSQAPISYLCVLTLGKASSDNLEKVNLPILIAEIRNILATESATAVSRFQDLLLQLGYLESELYHDFNYIQNHMRAFEVKEGFPRICPDALISGISKVSYHINLSECTNFEIQILEWGLIND